MTKEIIADASATFDRSRFKSQVIGRGHVAFSQPLRDMSTLDGSPSPKFVAVLIKVSKSFLLGTRQPLTAQYLFTEFHSYSPSPV